MRFFVLTFLLLTLSLTAHAIEAPSGQTVVDAGKILRGHFVEEHQLGNGQMPMQTSGHFVVAPAEGLIWGIEKPFPTLTIVTPHAAVQDLGGLVIKLPAKNLRHLYDMVGGALAGDWHNLESDFTITKSGGAAHWQMVLTPLPDGQHKLPYKVITVSGSRFVEDIVLTKADGNIDMFTFSDETLAAAPPTPQESATFGEAAR